MNPFKLIMWLPPFVKKMEKLNREKGWNATLLGFLIVCGILFTSGWNSELVTGLEGMANAAALQSFQNMFVPEAISSIPGIWGGVANALIKALPTMFLGATLAGVPTWSILGTGKKAEYVWNIAKTSRERNQEIQKLSERVENFDRSKVNDDGRDEYLSYDGTLIKLFREPSLEKKEPSSEKKLFSKFFSKLFGKSELEEFEEKVIVPEGITALAYGAFDRYVASESLQNKPRFRKNIESLVLPKTIRRLDVRNIPTDICLEFKDSRTKMLCHGKEDMLSSRRIKVAGTLFTGLLKDFNATEIPDKYNVGFDGLSDNEEVSLNDSFSKISDSLIKIHLMDILHEHMLCGVLPPQSFRSMVGELLPDYKERYTGPDAIKHLYGSEQNAIDRFALKYYEAENIRREQSTKEWQKKHPDTVPMTRAVLNSFLLEVEEAKRNPESFRKKNADKLGKIASELGLELGLESKSKEPVENKQEETFQPPREMHKGKLIDPDIGSVRNNVQDSTKKPAIHHSSWDDRDR